MTENKPLVVLPAEILQAALDYLVSKPYSETAKLIELIVRNTAKVQQPETATSEEAPAQSDSQA